ncbi:MAG: patatin-like phospholipase family protein [Dehalococcoidia bacterium]
MASEGNTLVIGGLGVKGLSNIGAIEALVEFEVPVKRVVASGISSLIGAQFALGRDLNSLSDELVRFFSENDKYLWGMERLSGLPRRRTRRVRDSFAYFLRERLFCQSNFNRLSILDWEIVDADLERLFGEVQDADLKLPLSISAIDLNKRREVLLENGRLVDRLKAGFAFPGLFPPVNLAGDKYVGSSFFCELPLSILTREHAPIVVVDIPSRPDLQCPGNVIENLARMDEIRSRIIKGKMLTKADRILSLEAVKDFEWGNYRQLTRQVELAYSETKRLLQEDPDIARHTEVS